MSNTGTHGTLGKYYQNVCCKCGVHVGGYYRKINGCLCRIHAGEYERTGL